MMTKQPDHSILREWLYLEPDGELNAGQRSSLQQHLSNCASCRRERDEMVRLQALLEQAKLPDGKLHSEEVARSLRISLLVLPVIINHDGTSLPCKAQGPYQDLGER